MITLALWIIVGLLVYMIGLLIKFNNNVVEALAKIAEKSKQ
jgi:hypothetical protein